jgi:hypothetical protein
MQYAMFNLDYQHDIAKKSIPAFHFNNIFNVLLLDIFCRITLHCIEILSDVILEILTY